MGAGVWVEYARFFFLLELGEDLFPDLFVEGFFFVLRLRCSFDGAQDRAALRMNG